MDELIIEDQILDLSIEDADEPGETEDEKESRAERKARRGENRERAWQAEREATQQALEREREQREALEASIEERARLGPPEIAQIDGELHAIVQRSRSLNQEYHAALVNNDGDTCRRLEAEADHLTLRKDSLHAGRVRMVEQFHSRLQAERQFVTKFPDIAADDRLGALATAKFANKQAEHKVEHGTLMQPGTPEFIAARDEAIQEARQRYGGGGDSDRRDDGAREKTRSVSTAHGASGRTTVTQVKMPKEIQRIAVKTYPHLEPDVAKRKFAKQYAKMAEEERRAAESPKKYY